MVPGASVQMNLLTQARAKKTVAVVVPMHNRSELTADEKVSFRHLQYYLKPYDKYLVVPESLEVSLPGCFLKRFGNQYFGSATANTQLLLSEEFYASFVEYKYILIYHLDALAFSDQLLAWCDKGLDYVAPPWIHSADSPWVKVPRVGNGGFSLRKVESFLRVLRSDRYWIDPKDYWTEFCRNNPRYLQYLNLPRKFLKRLLLFNNVRRELIHWPFLADGRGNEDYFWSDEAIRYYPDFKVASLEEGLRFAFEVAPRTCLELSHGQLPFGCHAWPRYDRAFWEPYLLKS